MRIRHASSEQEAQWIRVEYQAKVGELYTLEEIRDVTHARAQLLANLFNLLIDKYDKLFPQYFQEVYDPDLNELRVGPYDDSPAGFRLLYKHGRANTSQWTRVTSPAEFVEALSNFFTVTESEVFSISPVDRLREDISDCITSIITHVKTKIFLETAFYRMAAAHHTPAIADPLEHLDQITMKPWAYISGGTMNTLVCAYHRREQKLTEMARWVESPKELLVFFIDTLKLVPYKILEEFEKKPKKSMLIHSPTHAFLLKPGITPFKEGWKSEGFTYTWVRDHLIGPRERFLEFIQLDEEMQKILIDELAKQVPISFRHYFNKVFSRMYGTITPHDFRDYVIDKIAHEKGLQFNRRGVISEEAIDSLLYTTLPFFPKHQLRECLEAIWNAMPSVTRPLLRKLQECIEEYSAKVYINVLHARQLEQIGQALIAIALGSTTSPKDLLAEFSFAMQQTGSAMPAPIICADTNWQKELFAFVVNPGTGMLDFWRVDPTGRRGYPMSVWREWLDGSRKDLLWGLYPRPYEYTSESGTWRSGNYKIKM